VARPERPEPAPFERFEGASRRVFRVPKKDADKGELRKKKEKEAREGDQAK
jgi:hypothetical protein